MPSSNFTGPTRRQVLIRASALAAAVPFGRYKAAYASQPKKGGSLRIGLNDSSTNETLDPSKISSQVDMSVTAGQLRNTLVEIDHTSRAIPELAESWEASKGSKIWRFNLRKGVEFHNGKTLNADDVIYSFNWHRGEKTTSPAKGLLSAVDDIRKEGENAVVFELNSGNVDFPYITSNYALQIVPAESTAGDMEKGIGTGGYVLEVFEPGIRALTRRNKNYWKDGRAHFDDVLTLGINDVTARINALRTGEVDVINQPDLKLLHLLNAAPNVQIVETTGRRHYTAPMLADVDPFQDNNVRLALKYAINREDILAKILLGYGSVGNDQPINAAYRYFDNSAKPKAYDPDKAKFHLKKAGLTTLKVQYYGSNAPYLGAVDTGILMSEHAKAAGIEIEVVRAPDDGFWDNTWQKQSFTCGNWFGRVVEDMIFTQAYSKTSDWNESHWKNGRFEELLVNARIETDEKLRAEMYAEMQRLVSEEGSTIIPVFANNLMGASNRLGHGPVASDIDLDGFRLAERWWFES